MSNVLITGAHGFVGANLSKYLADTNHYQLFALDISKNAQSPYHKEYTWKEIHKVNFNSINTIIHLAGKAHDTGNTSQAAEYYEINVGITKLIFEKFINSDVQKFIYFSSVKAVADSIPNEFLTEDHIPNPQTPYGKSKLEAEKYLMNQVVEDGKSIFILRPAMIHGPGNKGNLNLLYNLINKGFPYPLGAFSNQRSFTSIGNLNFVIRAFLDRDLEPGIYQIADKETVSTNEIIELIGEAICKKPRIWHISPWLIKYLAKAGNRFHFPLNSERLQRLTESYMVSNKKLVNALGAELPIHAREGLILTLNDLKRNQS